MNQHPQSYDPTRTVTLYTCGACTDCTAAEKHLDDMHVIHCTVTVTPDDPDGAADRLRRRTGLTGTPIVTIDRGQAVTAFHGTRLDLIDMLALGRLD